ncbi:MULTISPECIES: barstar family protein [Pandoraea]|jgi:RNAse (barnase) inhibitor barstar|nr:MULTISPECIES: barstar family protein [Pandoraea]AHB04355.2 barnase inhibitor [Pandoraea pnomenusa 3kgm]AHB75257.1 barnase inhibitor [Pandoraea pnomenusa]AHN76372.1 barnase inhibitor [Pandoraea pnomenusa]AIU27001.1 barnase inhibitor [Pandoraea pnomenusa]ANC44211.1 barnase inhibitor [Pandoraea pnomenusa]
MSEPVFAQERGKDLMADPFGAGEGNLFKQVLGLHAVARAGHRHTLSEEGDMSLFKTVRPNIVQSIRAFRVPELAAEAERLGQHFLYANCSQAQSKAEVLETIATSFLFPKHFGKNYDALHDCLTDLVSHCGPQPGFVVVLEGLPIATKFDKDGRETLLDVFRDAAEFWAERRVTFRVFYSFA